MRSSIRLLLVVLPALTRAALAQDQLYTVSGPAQKLAPADVQVIRRWLQTAALPPQNEVANIINNTLLNPELRDRGCKADSNNANLNNGDFAVAVHAVGWQRGEIEVDRWYIYQGGRAPVTVQGRRAPLATARALGVRKLGLLELHLTTVNQPGHLDYRVEVSRRRATNLQHLGDLLKVINTLLPNAAPLTSPDNLWGGDCMPVLPTSEIVVRMRSISNNASASELSKHTLLNERLHRWDVSVALPLKRLRGLEYDVDNASVAPKEVDKESLFALLDIYPISSDLSGESKWEWPHIVAGVGIAKKPLERYMVGGSVKLYGIRTFAGAAWVETDAPNAERHRESQFIWGLHMSAKSILDFIGGDK